MEMNALLSTFHDTPAMLHPGMQSRFEAYLRSAQINLSRIEAPTSKITMQDDFWPAPDTWLAAYRPYTVKNEILMIPVKGVLLFGVGYAIGDYATGYVYISKALERGLADPQVKGIAFIIDSPGGHVAGNFDLADKIFAARGKKPIHAFAAENAYSAAYSIASACKTVTVARTGGVGSIGVVTVHLDVSKAIDGAGLKVTLIHYGKHKVDGNAYESLSAGAKARIQARIDGLGELFVSTVARNRAMDAQAVRDTEALTFGAEEAVSLGLADRVGVLDDAITNFQNYLSGSKEPSMTPNKSAPLKTPTATVQAPPLSRVEQALRNAGYPPRSMGREAVECAAAGERSPKSKTDGYRSGHSISKIERAMQAAGYAPRLEA
ncbi:S49 family peptidase [Rhizobium bangladeshense]|uniref:S49 family peptidase n=1 Tax=Rhizobium bangladeshense TaxID=1138189 RepID=UPI001C8350AA|nr:S49 family peptidase [Rhizobium bangladeshense]MBX4899492.1 S49 family peptidase [Rhizobium bangladeshense]MBY3617705.1 S49 family peptidase [Rhizobium bangladeshense]